VYDLAASLKALAKHHLQIDQAHLDRMTAIIRRLDLGKTGMTEKNRRRLQQFDDPQKVEALIGLPFELMQIGARDPQAHQAALQAQTAIAIGIDLVAPIRIKNLAELDLERDFVGLGRRGPVLIDIAPDLVKNRKPLRFPLPAVFLELIERY